MLLFFSERTLRHRSIRSGKTSAKAIISKSGPELRKSTAAPVPLSPHPIRAAFNGFPSGAISTNENIPNSSAEYDLPEVFFASLAHDVIIVGVATPKGMAAPNTAEFVKNFLLFIVNMLFYLFLKSAYPFDPFRFVAPTRLHDRLYKLHSTHALADIGEIQHLGCRFLTRPQSHHG